MILCQRFAHFFVNDGKSKYDRMNHMIIPLFRTTDTSHSNHFIVFFSISLCKVTVGDYQVISQCFAHMIRLDKVQKFLAITLFYRMVGIPCKSLQIGEMDPCRCLLLIRRI